ncbi:MAG TPA: hypothetical protein VFJ14_17265 [Nocardioidaceae bacterium]|nr:hypothetical protein [Nocardioidaceae bacterium]
MTEPTPDEQGTDIDLETPEVDAAEQRRAVDDTDHDDRDDRTGGAARGETPLEVDPADAAEQDQVAGSDDDEYR